jgi:hypothetical protein
VTYNTLGVARRTKRFKGAEGAGARRVLVDGPNPNEAVNTAVANAGNLVGALQQYGFAEIETAGAIPHGSRVNLAADGGNAANRGRVKAVDEIAGTVVNLVGIADEAATAAGQRIRVDIRRFGEQITV